MNQTMIRNKEFPAHSKNRKVMYWGAATKKKLAEMDDSHLKIVFQMVKNNYPDTAIINGYSKQAWLKGLETEVNYRNAQIDVLAGNTCGKLRMVIKKLKI